MNLHPSYLPYNRGKDPYVWSILNEKPFGTTIHEMNEKIDDGNYLDIHLPNIHNRKGTHIWFNTPKSGGIKIGFYCRDKEFVKMAVDASSDTIETYSSGLRPKGAPVFDNIEDAIEAVQSIIGYLSRKLN